MIHDTIQTAVVALTRSSGPDAQHLGQLIQDIHTALKSSSITTDEFNELIRNVETTRQIVVNADDIILNRQIHDAILALIELAKIAKPL